VVNGRQVPYEEAAQPDFQLAKAALDEGKYDLAAQRFSAFVQRYKDSQLVDEALFRRAQALTKAGGCRNRRRRCRTSSRSTPLRRTRTPPPWSLPPSSPSSARPARLRRS